MVKIIGRPGLGGWLEKRLRDEKLSLRGAADRSGLSHATISDILKGGRPSAATIVKLAEAFGADGHEKADLKDLLLSLSGYRSNGKKEKISEPMARVIEKLSHLDTEQLEIVENLASFVTTAGQPGMRSARSSTGVLVLPRLRLNFYLSFDEGETESGHFSKLPPDMQETIIDLTKRYKKENGQSPDLRKADERSSSE